MLSTTYGTGCAQAMLPPWLYENGWDEARRILADDEGRKKVKADMNRYWRFLDFGQWDRLLRIIAPHMPEVTKMSFEELCDAWGREPCDAFLDVFMKTETIEEVRAIEMVGVMFDEQTMIDTVVNDDIYLWMSDSYTTTEKGDARTGNMSDYMGYMYFFTRYVKELGVISIEKAVNKATKRVADHYRLENRGQIKEGYFADINIFDINNLTINATFTDPCRYCSGFDYVIVNGTLVIEKGQHTGERAGRVLRRK
jgi:N-acyl-D-amino-acid deacylase